MKDKKFAGIIALGFIAILTFFAIMGSDFALNGGNSGESMDVSGSENVKEAIMYADENGTVSSYDVTTSTQGFGGEVLVTVSFEGDKNTISAVSIVADSETTGLGSLVTEADFTSQFAGKSAPLTISDIDAVSGATISSTAVVDGINSANEFLQ